MRIQPFLAVLLFPFCAFAQPSVSWDRTLGGDDRLNIINTNGASFEIFNARGQKLYRGISDIGQTTIDFPHPSGTYLLKMADQIQVVRIIK